MTEEFQDRKRETKLVPSLHVLVRPCAETGSGSPSLQWKLGRMQL